MKDDALRSPQQGISGFRLGLNLKTLQRNGIASRARRQRLNSGEVGRVASVICSRHVSPETDSIERNSELQPPVWGGRHPPQSEPQRGADIPESFNDALPRLTAQAIEEIYTMARRSNHLGAHLGM
jgi:hypothetical protein